MGSSVWHVGSSVGTRWEGGFTVARTDSLWSIGGAREYCKILGFEDLQSKNTDTFEIPGTMTVRRGGCFVGLVQESPGGILGFPVLRALLQVGYQWSPIRLKSTF